MSDHFLCRSILEREFNLRRDRNSSFSLRSFAMFLGVGAATLSDVLKGKRKLSKQSVIKVCEKLGLPEIERELLLSESTTKTINKGEVEKYRLKEDVFQLISDWYHFAIIELQHIKGHKADPKWISSKLKISELQATMALERLLSLKLIKIVRGKIVGALENMATTGTIPSDAIRKRHQQILGLAQRSIAEDSMEERFPFEITMAIDPSKLPEIRDKIRKYCRKLQNDLEKENQVEIYSLWCGVFPLREK